MLLIIDMNGLVHQFFHVRKEDDRDDVTTRTLEKLERMREYYLAKPGFHDMKFVAVFDNPQDTFRHILFPQYKEHRTKHDDLPKILRETREAVGKDADWITLNAPFSFESDDLIASIAAQYPGKVMIYSRDGDMNACLEKDRVVIIKTANVDLDTNALTPEYWNYEMFVAKYGFHPRRWPEYMAIVGDSSDGLQGLSWEGCGPKKAAEIMRECNSPDEADLSDVTLNKKQQATFIDFAKNYSFHMKLLRLRTDIPWPTELGEINEQHYNATS